MRADIYRLLLSGYGGSGDGQQGDVYVVSRSVSGRLVLEADPGGSAGIGGWHTCKVALPCLDCLGETLVLSFVDAKVPGGESVERPEHLVQNGAGEPWVLLSSELADRSKPSLATRAATSMKSRA